MLRCPICANAKVFLPSSVVSSAYTVYFRYLVCVCVCFYYHLKEKRAHLPVTIFFIVYWDLYVLYKIYEYGIMLYYYICCRLLTCALSYTLTLFMWERLARKRHSEVVTTSGLILYVCLCESWWKSQHTQKGSSILRDMASYIHIHILHWSTKIQPNSRIRHNHQQRRRHCQHDHQRTSFCAVRCYL